MKVIVVYKKREFVSLKDTELKSDEFKNVKSILSNGKYMEVLHEMSNMDKERGIIDITRIPKEEIDEIKIKRD